MEVKTIIAKNQFRMSLLPIKYTHRQIALNYTRQALFGSGWKLAENFAGEKLDMKHRERCFLTADSFSGDKYHEIKSGPYCGKISSEKLIVSIEGLGEMIFSKRELLSEVKREKNQPKLFRF